MCCSPWGRKESDVTELLNSTEMNGDGDGDAPEGSLKQD